jgi:hypothetical protein
MSKENTSTKIVNTIPLKTARKWSKRWAKVEGDYDKHHHLNEFLIPKADLIQVLAEGVDAVRAYIGVDDEHCEKLMIVGRKLNAVSGVYEDMITVGVTNMPNLQNDIYDFTSPCLPACDPNSPLNQ